MHDNYSKMETEKTNPRTQQIDLCGTEEMVAMINREGRSCGGCGAGSGSADCPGGGLHV